MKTVFVIAPEDNVGTAVLEDSIQRGDRISAAGRVTGISVTATAAIPFGHKIALRFIQQGDPIIKYGLKIGTATRDIQPGDHVHTHNVKRASGYSDEAAV